MTIPPTSDHPGQDPVSGLPAAARLRRRLHRLFEASLIFKAVFALVETLSGLTLYLTGSAAIARTVGRLTLHELSEDPGDHLALLLQKAADSLSVDSGRFYGLYLLSHGLVKLLMVIALQRRAAWAYPASMGVFALFILYQLYRYSHTGSPFLLALSAFDVLLIWLIWREYRDAIRPESR